MRPRIHATHAARQKAYLKRRKERNVTPNFIARDEIRCDETRDQAGRPRIYPNRAARDKAYLKRRKRSVTNHFANAPMIAHAARLYIKDGHTVADVTFRKGAFWTRTDCSRFTLLKSDLEPINDTITRMDCTALSYADASIDVLVLDPPYAHSAKTHLTSNQYNLATVGNWYHEDIIGLYERGMREAFRVLKPNGQLWVKCKDEIQSGQQRRSHIEIHSLALSIGYSDKDMFTLHTRPPNSKRWDSQHHAYKTTSYLWIFTKSPLRKKAAQTQENQ